MTKALSRTHHTYAEVAPAVPLSATAPQTYTYKVPNPTSTNIQPFSQVAIPFGRQRVSGIVLELHSKPTAFPTKPLAVVSPLALTKQQVQFARWIARTRQGSFGYTLRLFQPPGRLSPVPVGSHDHATTGPRQTRPTTKSSSLTTSADLKALLKILPDSPGAFVEQDPVRRHSLLSQLTSHFTNSGAQVLILVPEKWIVDKMSAVLNKVTREPVAKVHGGQSNRQLAAIWHQVRNGDNQLIIGTQKALFLPWQHLQLVVVEEEQYTSHKLWDQYPRLHNLDAAQELIRIHNAQSLYTSSFPSLRLRHAIRGGTVKQYGAQALTPRTSILNFSFDDKLKHYSLPQAFIVRLKTWIKDGDTVLMLYNRRGLHQYIICRHCQSIYRCPDCGVSLTVHRQPQTATAKKITSATRLICHHCNRRHPYPKKCASCQRNKLFPAGLGLAGLADIVTRAAGTRALFIDRDILTASPTRLRQATAHQLLLGTSAVFSALPGLKFDRLVWLLPEQEVLFPDFRSKERALITLARLQQQAAQPRRSIILITRQPGFVEQVLSRPVDEVLDKELADRARHSYPPVTDLVRLTVTDKNKASALKKGTTLRQLISKRLGQQPSASVANITIRGPFQSFVPLRRGRHEAHLVLTGPLSTLTTIYQGLPLDIADVSPARIL